MHVVKNYVNGRFREAENTGFLKVHNPSTGDPIAEVPISTRGETERAIEAAAQAYSDWSRTPVSRRVRPLYELVGKLRGAESRIVRTLVTENGKSVPDARAEMKRAFENIEAACSMPILQQGRKLIGCSQGIDGEVIREPLGVFGVIAPFNFPAMVPFWFVPYAIATGNTVVLKTSEQTPMTMELIAEFIHEVSFPDGVFNIVNGDRVVGETLVESSVVRGVSVVGSTRTCRAVAEGCTRTGKRFQAFGGAKNHLVVMPDAGMDYVIRNILTSCFGCAGQRCMAAAAVIAVGQPTYTELCERFIAASRKIPVADPLDPKVADEPLVLGPVISAKAKHFVHDMIAQGVREGATLALDGRDCVVLEREDGYFVGPTVFVDVRPGMAIHRTEIFGPVVCILRAESLDEAIDTINGGEYGNGGSIYTQDGSCARRFKLETRVGMIGINVGIPAPVAYLPFGGTKASNLSDTKTQGEAIVDFYTQDKIVVERFPDARRPDLD
jgi:malonate-semialdehyde dehydrogenase (acetylating)/methylmalonate-semialdehyde dehydrogenase